MSNSTTMLPGSEPIKVDDISSTSDFLRVAIDRFVFADSFWRDNYNAALADITFAYQDQWDATARASRIGRPCLTLNKLPTFIDQVIGDQRQNRPGIIVHPVEADKPSSAQGDQQQQQPGKVKNVAGTKDYSESELRNGLIRNIEQLSSAESHYDTAFQHAVEGGFGWLRVLTGYSSQDTFEQDLIIKSVRNRFAVLIDPQAISEPDFSSANFCFISELMRRKEFVARYPNAAAGWMSTTTVSDHRSWYYDDLVRVGEYFWREPVTRELVLLSDGRTMWLDVVKPVLDELQAQGIVVVRNRKVKTHKVMWAKITSSSILEGPVEMPFDTIPVVPVLGKEVTIGDVVHYRGLIRYSKDAQQMHNYWMSAATERVALAPKAPYIADAKSIENFEGEWKRSNTSNSSVLRYNHRTDVPPPRREQPPQMPAAELQLAMAAGDEIKDTTGLFNASIGEKGTATSGKQEIAQQRQGDRGTFAYIDNLSRAMQRIGKLLVYAIPQVYDSERIVRLKFEDGGGDWVKINESILDQQTGKLVQVHDMSAGKYDVTVKVGPSYQTQRLEAADSLMQFMQAVPQSSGVILDLVAKNMDWPGSAEIAKRLQKVLPPGILSPEETQEAGIQPPQPTPADQAAMAQAEADKASAEASKAMAQAKMMEAQVKMQEAQNAPMIAQQEHAQRMQQRGNDSPSGHGDTQQDGAGIEEMVRHLVAQAMAEIMSQQQA